MKSKFVMQFHLVVFLNRKEFVSSIRDHTLPNFHVTGMKYFTMSCLETCILQMAPQNNANMFLQKKKPVFQGFFFFFFYNLPPTYRGDLFLNSEHP